MFIDEADEQNASKAGNSQGPASQGWLAPSTQPCLYHPQHLASGVRAQ